MFIKILIQFKFLLLLFLSYSIAIATSVPPLINYQGILVDAQGQPITHGSKRLTFSIYDSVAGGTLIWGPQVFDTVPVINGMFNVILGSTDTTGRLITDAFSDQNRFLGITVDDGVEITPRQQLLSAPFSLNANNAKMLGGGTVTVSDNNVAVGTETRNSNLAVSGGVAVGSNYSNVAVNDGDLILPGKIGIGTTSPNFTLDVRGITNIENWANQRLTQNGYVQLGSILIQWGKTVSIITGGNTAVTFPIPFPSACLNIQTTLEYPHFGHNSYGISVGNLSKNGFTAHSNNAVPGPQFWLAIGY